MNLEKIKSCKDIIWNVTSNFRENIELCVMCKLLSPDLNYILTKLVRLVTSVDFRRNQNAEGVCILFTARASSLSGRTCGWEMEDSCLFLILRWGVRRKGTELGKGWGGRRLTNEEDGVPLNSTAVKGASDAKSAAHRGGNVHFV